MTGRNASVSDIPNDDLHLTQRVAEGDKEAFKAMYVQCSEDVFRYVSSLTRDPSIAEELTQETFSRIWHNRTALTADRPWRAYIFIVARNLVLHHVRHQRIVTITHQSLAIEVPEPTIPGMAHPITSPETDLLHQEDLQRLESAIGDLPPRMQEVFRLRWQSELTYREIAHTLGLSERTVENQLARALVLVRQTMLLEKNTD